MSEQVDTRQRRCIAEIPEIKAARTGLNNPVNRPPMTLLLGIAATAYLMTLPNLEW